MKTVGKTKEMIQLSEEVLQCENSNDEAKKCYHESQSEIKSTESQNSNGDKDNILVVLGRCIISQVTKKNA